MTKTLDAVASRRCGAMRLAHLAAGLFALGTLPAAAADRIAHDGIASFYGREHHGGPTSSGERFNMNAMTAAHRTAPLGSHLQVTNLANGKTIVVRINDRGPFVRGRIIDLSRAAAAELGFIGSGLTRVHVQTADAGTPAGTTGATRLAEAEEPAATGSVAPKKGAADRAAARAAEHTVKVADAGKDGLDERERLLIARSAAN